MKTWFRLAAGALLGLCASQAMAQDADLLVTKTAPASIVAGGDITYTIGLVNAGPDDAQSVTLDDVLPAGTTFVSFTQDSGPTFSCATPPVGGSGTVTCTIATLAVGSSTFTLVAASGGGTGGATIANTATVNSTTNDPDAGNNSATAFTIVIASADMATSKAASASVVAGGDITYTIGVVNAGPGDASSVTLTDPLPAGTTFVSFTQDSGPAFSCTTPAAGGAGTVTCTLATLAAGSSSTFTLVAASGGGTGGTTITNTATVNAATADPDAGNNSATASTIVIANADVAATKAASASVVAGGDIIYTIGVVNAGPGDASSVTLTDALPAGTTFVSFTQDSGPAFSCTTPAAGGAGAVTCTLATLASGSSSSFTLVAASGGGTGGTTITNTATVNAATADPDAGDNSATASTIVTASADMAITKAASASVVAGGNITYSIAVSNAGPSNAALVTLTDTLPAGTTFVSLVQNSGPAFGCTTPAVGAAGTVNCSTASLNSGTNAAFTLIVASGAASGGSTITNVAAVSTITSDPDPANNIAAASTSVTASADISVAKAARTGVAPGGIITYDITVANAGPGTAQAVALSDVLPAGTTFVGFVQNLGPVFVCVVPPASPGAVVCAPRPLNGGEVATFVLMLASSAGSAGTTITNTATVTTTTADPNPANNAASASTTVSAAAPIPTLGEWAIVLLAAGLACLGLAALRKNAA